MLFGNFPCHTGRASALGIRYTGTFPLSQRIRFLNGKIDAFAAPSAREGLYRHLLAVQREGRAEIPGGYSRLARDLNMGRASLYRSLEGLEREGLIRREGRTVYLIQTEKEP